MPNESELQKKVEVVEVEEKTILEILREYKIIVPIIQRDYVQGRKNPYSERARKGLLGSFYTCLSNESDVTLDMNFTYGYCRDSQSKKIFMPVDGQQRLTALYLLCWYFAVCSDKIGKISDFDFSYETRFSAAAFFQKFINNSPEKNIVDIVKNNKGNTMTAQIKELPTFQSEWQNDPTIRSALVFLSDISDYEKGIFKEEAATYFDRLHRIKFSLIPKESENAEQEASQIYIKMNARGKPLEEFENIKAMFDKIEKSTGDNGSNGNFSWLYDSKYLNKLFRYSRNSGRKPGRKLKEITNEINLYSTSALNLIFDLCELKEPETDMIDTVFRDSREKQTVPDNKKEKYQKFFDMVKCFFEFFCKYSPEKYDDDFFLTFFNNSRLSRNILLLYYLYWFKKHHNTLPDERATDKLLEAANFILCGVRINPGNKVLNRLAERAAGYDDIEEMFLKREWSELSDKDGEYSVIGASDEFNVRLHEWWLRILVLNHKSRLITKEIIDDITGTGKENRSKRLQFLFYISDMWDKTNAEDVLKPENLEHLKQNFETAGNFFPISEEIIHRRYYAAACYFDSDKNDFYSADKINQCEKNHVWDESYYTWDNDNNISKDKLTVIRTMYEHYDTIKEKIDRLKSLAAGDPFRKCWITYALILKSDVLLKNKVTLDANKMMVTSERPVDVVILKDIGGKNYEYGLMNFTKEPPKRISFAPGEEFKQFEIRQKSSQNYNLFLYSKIDSNSINQKVKDIDTNCVYMTDNKTAYTVRHGDSSDPLGKYKEYKFDITEHINKIKEVTKQANQLYSELESSEKLRWGIMLMSIKLSVSRSNNVFETKNLSHVNEISDGNIKIKIENDNMVIEYGSKTLKFPGKRQTRTCIFEEIPYQKDPDYSDGELYNLVLESIKNK